MSYSRSAVRQEEKMTGSICIVIPCFNEEKRVDIDRFKSVDRENIYFIFVNDGSSDNTYNLLSNNIGSNMYVLDLDKNYGKAEAVRQGMFFLKTLPIYDKIEWVGFMDADLSTPLWEIDHFFIYNDAFSYNAEAIWGSRVKRLGSNVKRKLKRHMFGRLFAAVTSALIDINCYDTQCGAKFFRKELIDAAFSEAFISKWIFDIEILLRLKDRTIIEYPLQEWIDVGGSKINIFSESLRILLDIVKIRRKYASRD
jgi:dolichyl-phosphate beta-glucosyltransferase